MQSDKPFQATPKIRWLHRFQQRSHHLFRARYALITVVILIVTLTWAWTWMDQRTSGVYHEGRSVHAWLRDWIQADRQGRETALEAFLEMDASAVLFLGDVLSWRDSPLLRFLLQAQPRLYPLRFGWVPASEYRAGALEILRRMGAISKSALPGVARALERGIAPGEKDGYRALLVGMGPDVIGPLLPVLAGTRETVVAELILAVWVEVLPRADFDGIVLSALVEETVAWLNSDEDAVALQAAAVLGRLGSDGQPAIPALIRVLDLPTRRTGPVAESVLLALGRIGGDAERVVPVLIESLDRAEERTRIAAAGALAQYGPQARAAVPALRHALWRPDDRAFAAVADALGRIGPTAGMAAMELALGLGHERAFIRALTASTLVRIDADPAVVLPRLTAALSDEDPYVRAHVATALGQLGAASSPVVQALAQRLFDGDESVQVAAILALGAIGPEARAAVPDLRRAWSNKQSGLGRHVLAALERIEGGADGSDPAHGISSVP